MSQRNNEILLTTEELKETCNQISEQLVDLIISGKIEKDNIQTEFDSQAKIIIEDILTNKYKMTENSETQINNILKELKLIRSERSEQKQSKANRKSM